MRVHNNICDDWWEWELGIENQKSRAIDPAKTRYPVLLGQQHQFIDMVNDNNIDKIINKNGMATGRQA